MRWKEKRGYIAEKEERYGYGDRVDEGGMEVRLAMNVTLLVIVILFAIWVRSKRGKKRLDK
ncbi:MAG: hypothetical protein LBU03_04405 [Tannerellaceae bacterium]|jgi:hypothetical protein|nr:hypothetical protein [Tannerellaceae bacterium]